MIMECYTKIDKDFYYIGYSDRRINLFENVYPVPEGVSYNSYLLLDNKTVLFDTVDHSVSSVYMDNLSALLGERPLDYVVVNHVEPDHSATLGLVLEKYKTAKVVCTKQASILLGQFFDTDFSERIVDIETLGELETGKHKFIFVKAPMIHWPEVMVTFDTATGTLFSADAFGSFGAVAGSIYADAVPFDEKTKEMYRRYYTNIVGKYGNFVQNALKTLGSLEIKRICPLHGRIWRKNISQLIEIYDKWSKFESEEQGVVIAYASVYGGTELACNLLANKLGSLGVEKIEMFDVSVTDASYILSSIMKYSHVVFASTTYNMGIFVKMEDLLNDFVAHMFKNKKIAVVENGSWSPVAKSLILKKLEGLKGNTIFESSLTVKSKIKKSQMAEIETLAEEIAKSFD
jgi:flavorubredoxin